MPPKRKSVKPAEVDWSSNKKKQQSSANFEDIMSKFLKDSEERLQDVKKNQEQRSRNRRSLN